MPRGYLAFIKAPLLILTFLSLSASVNGCRPQDRANETKGPSEDLVRSSELSPAEIQRLKSLPYAGYAPVEQSRGASGVTVLDRDRSCPGYTLYVMNRRCSAELIDAEGQVIRAWSAWPGRVWTDGSILPEGDFIVTGADTSVFSDTLIDDDARYAMRFGWDGQLKWKRKLTSHHDINLTPGGQLVTLTF